MLIDCASEAPEAVTADVAIVGSGAAGQAAARRLLSQGHSIVLIESGGLDHAEASADLNRGDIVGQEYHPLEHSRLRFFGGTTAVWGGRVAEFDAIDFERRDWVPHSGWPFGATAVGPTKANDPAPAPRELNSRVSSVPEPLIPPAAPRRLSPTTRLPAGLSTAWNEVVKAPPAESAVPWVARSKRRTVSG